MSTWNTQHAARQRYIVSKKTLKAIAKRESAKVDPKAEPKKTVSKKVTVDE